MKTNKRMAFALGWGYLSAFTGLPGETNDPGRRFIRVFVDGFLHVHFLPLGFAWGKGAAAIQFVGDKMTT